MKTCEINTTSSNLFDITQEIQEYIDESGVKKGIVVIMVPHTTAGVTIISRLDSLGFEDIIDDINRIIPTRIDFKHQYDTPSDAAGHIKSAIIGTSLPLIIENGTLVLGSSQGIFFFEFDGPRKRKYHLQLLGDQAKGKEPSMNERCMPIELVNMCMIFNAGHTQILVQDKMIMSNIVTVSLGTELTNTLAALITQNTTLSK